MKSKEVIWLEESWRYDVIPEPRVQLPPEKRSNWLETEDEAMSSIEKLEDSNTKQRILEDKKTTALTPSVVRNNVSTEQCEPDSMGKCVIHDCVMSKLKVSTKKWKDRGKSRGFGWVTCKTTKYCCKFKKTAAIPDNLERLRDSQSGTNVKNTDGANISYNSVIDDTTTHVG